MTPPCLGAPAHAAAVADLRRRRARLRVRLLRAADAADHRPAGARGSAERRAQQPRGQRVGRHDAVRAGGRRRHLRAARRLSDGPLRPPARAGVEHPALRLLGACSPACRQSVGALLFWRCCTFVGVCVEFVAAVAWLAELFTDPKQRERVVGYTQAFGSIGGLMVTAPTTWSSPTGRSLPAVHGGHEAWRYTLISGVIPAIPLIIIRPFLPESPAWQQKKRAGTLKRPSFAELFRPEFRRTTIVTTIMMACAYAAAFGAIQQMPRIVPGLEEVRDAGADGAGADHQRRAVVSGVRRPRRTHPPRRSGDRHRLAPNAAVRLPDSRPHAAADRVLAGADRRPAARAVGHLLRRHGDHRAVQFLGQLSAARLPDALARAPARASPPTSAAA